MLSFYYAINTIGHVNLFQHRISNDVQGIANHINGFELEIIRINSATLHFLMYPLEMHHARLINFIIYKNAMYSLHTTKKIRKTWH